jgi:signal transduction histidine kinase
VTEATTTPPTSAPPDRQLSGIAHELRTPLNSIIGFSDVLLDGGGGELTPEQRAQLGMINRSGWQLLALVDRLLDLWRLEAGELPLHVAEVDLREALRRLTARFARAAAERGLGCRIELDAGLRLRTDASRVEQALEQLLRNALQHTAAGSVCVRAVRLGAVARVSVEDSGCGIPPERQALLFSPFASVDGAGNGRRHDGSGLGLALARRLVEALGGRIGVRSRPGHGSVFWFDLPLD